MATVATPNTAAISPGASTAVSMPTLGQSITPAVSATPITPKPTTPTTPSTGVPAALQTPTVSAAAVPTTPVSAAAVTPTATTGIPTALQQQPASAAISSTGIPAGWKVEDYQKDYSAEYNRIKALNPNDPRLPLLQAARATKIAGMTDEQLKAAGVDRQGNPLPKPPVAEAHPAVQLGTLSSKYESNGNPGAVSSGAGDPGGKSYGTYQLASNMGTVNTFMTYLKTVNPNMYNTLYTAYTKGGVGFGANFDAAWKQLATSNPTEFQKVQHDFIQQQYYTPAATQLKAAGIDMTQHPGLQDVLWSTAVQHGVNGAISIFKTAVKPGMSDKDAINAIYAERSRRIQGQSNLGASVRAGVLNRYKQENADALAALAKLGTTPAATTPTTTTPAATTAAAGTTTPTTGVPSVLTGTAGTTGGTATAVADTTNYNVPISTRQLPTVNAIPQGQVPLADQLTAKGYQVAWDSATGNILVNGKPVLNSEVPGASIYQGHTYVTPEVLNAIEQKYAAGATGATTPTVQPTQVTLPDGTQKTFTNEATGQPWNIDDYKGDYSAEWNRIVSMNPADPRLDMLDKARADKILADPTKYPDLVAWANDIKNGTWKASDWKGNYQGEINRLRATNPADPRITQLEHLYAAQILSDKSSKYSQSQKDWAIDKDKEGWKVENYKDNYAAEMDRIKAFNPTDPRLKELEAARAVKILTAPEGTYAASETAWAEGYQAKHGLELQAQQTAQGYEQQKVAADIQTQQAIKTITDYYKKAGLEAGGQAAAAIRGAAMQGLAGQQKLSQDEQMAISKISMQGVSATSATVHQQIVDWNTTYANMIAAVAKAGEAPQQTYNYLINNAEAVISAIGPTNYNNMIRSLMKQLGVTQ